MTPPIALAPFDTAMFRCVPVMCHGRRRRRFKNEPLALISQAHLTSCTAQPRPHMRGCGIPGSGHSKTRNIIWAYTKAFGKFTQLSLWISQPLIGQKLKFNQFNSSVIHDQNGNNTQSQHKRKFRQREKNHTITIQTKLLKNLKEFYKYIVSYN